MYKSARSSVRSRIQRRLLFRSQYLPTHKFIKLDPYVFVPPGSGSRSLSQRYGSGFRSGFGQNYAKMGKKKNNSSQDSCFVSSLKYLLSIKRNKRQMVLNRTQGMNVIREKLWLAYAWTKKNNHCYVLVLEPDPDQGENNTVLWILICTVRFGVFWIRIR
jgi:hypothetical protein